MPVLYVVREMNANGSVRFCVSVRVSLFSFVRVYKFLLRTINYAMSVAELMSGE